MSRLLHAAGYSVTPCESARIFLDHVTTETQGCILLDARMPGMSGENLYDELQKRGVHMPVIFVTADDDLETRQKAQNMKAAAFFRKPVDGTALLDAVRWAMTGVSA